MSYSGDDMTDDTADDLPDDALGDVRGGVTNDAGDARNGIPPGAIAAAAMHDWLKDVPGADQDNLAALTAMAPVSAPGVGDADTNLAAAANITPTDVADLTRVSDPLHPDPASEIASAAPASVAGGEAPALPSYDRSFVVGHEGDRSDIYPPPVLPAGVPKNSGFTTGAGMDASKHDARDYANWGVSGPLADFLTSIKGYTGQAALDYYAQHKKEFHRISDDDRRKINAGVANDIERQVQTRYDAADPATKFADLDPRYRTVIMDLAYQSGPNPAKSDKDRGISPALWSDLTAGNWDSAASILENSNNYRNRNLDRAYYLRNGVPRPIAPRIK